MRPVLIGTRGSALALRQARLVQEALAARHPVRAFEIRTLTSHADAHPDLPLAAMRGEGVFVKELERALQDRSIDVAVHSLKDMPLASAEGLVIAAVVAREEPYDALVSRDGEPFDRLPAGSRIGTSSLRRQSQLKHRRPDVETSDIRGNVDTRLRKLEEGRYDAIVLAAGGLCRLGWSARITERLTWMLPEPGQGTIAVQSRGADTELNALLRPLDHAPTRQCVMAERGFLQALGGGCRVPIAALARLEDHGRLSIDGLVASADGGRVIRRSLSGEAAGAEELGRTLGRQLLGEGAGELLIDRSPQV